MKYSNLIGVAAALILIIACFLPWAYYPDIDKTFSGFFSERNHYGKPGKVLLFFACICMLLFVIPKVWAKRINLLAAVIIVAYGIKSFILFSSCYMGICPEKRAGLYLMIVSSIIVLISALLPEVSIDPKSGD
jgi:hypothetical protein